MCGRAPAAHGCAMDATALLASPSRLTPSVPEVLGVRADEFAVLAVMTIAALATLGATSAELAALGALVAGPPQVVVITALGMLVCGIGLWGARHAARALGRTVTALAGGMMVAWTTAALAADVAGFELVQFGVGASGLPPLVLLSGSFAGVGLLLATASSSRRAQQVRESCAAGIGLLGVILIDAYIFEVSAGTRSAETAFGTGIAFLAVAGGLLFVTPNRGLAALLTADSTAGCMARALLPLALLMPLATAVLQVAGQRLGWWTPALGAALTGVLGTAAWFATLATATGRLRVMERRQAHAEARLLQSNRTVTARVAQRTAELSAANHELAGFAHSMTHDLRAPLRAILGFTTILREHHAATLDGAGRDYLGRVASAAQRMDETIAALLEFAGLARAQPRVEAVDLVPLAHETLASLRAANTQRRVALIIDDAIPACGDRRLLGIVMQNLLENAWKFTRQRAVAHIAVSATTVDGHTVYAVSDDGAGFDMRCAERLFIPFERLHAAHEFEGHGLGLAAVARIVRRHGGRVWAESRPDAGATFRFTLAAQVAP